MQERSTEREPTGVERLAEMMERINARPLSSAEEESARLCLLDTLGVGIYGATQPEAGMLVKAAQRLGSGSVSVWGSGEQLEAGAAALVCGSLCHLRELDDVHYAILHTGCVCVPAAIAASQLEGQTLGQLMKAIVCGVEIMARISLGMDYMEHRVRGWHGTATCGAFGAAAAVGTVLRLNRAQMSSALGIAGSRTGGTWAFAMDGSMSKRLHPGLAARDGLVAAYLAQEGVTGPHYVLEAEDGGFYRLFSPTWNIDRAVEPHDRLEIENVEYKWFASCKSVHSPISAALAIHRENPGRTPEDVAQIRVEVNYSALSMAGRDYEEDSVVSAQISIPYGVALGLLGRSGQGEDYTLEALKDPTVRCLADKVEVVESEEFNHLRETEHLSGARVTVSWNDGTQSAVAIKHPKGSVADPLTPEDVKRKFLSLTIPVLGEIKAEKLMHMVLDGAHDLPVAEIVAAALYQRK